MNFDLAAPIRERGQSMRFEFLKGELAPSGASTKAQVHAGNQLTTEAIVRFRFWPRSSEHGGVREVRMEAFDRSLRPADLQRLPWARFFAAAEATNRLDASDEELTDLTTAAIGAVPGRPGRRGHDPAFLPWVAKRYNELVSDRKHPVKCIAEEMVVERSTAANWVQQARKKGLLPEGHRGRAG